MHRYTPYHRGSNRSNDLRVLQLQEERRQEPGPLLKDAWKMLKIVPDIYKQCGTLMSDEKRREANILWVDQVLKDQGYVPQKEEEETPPHFDATAVTTATAATATTTTLTDSAKKLTTTMSSSSCSGAKEYLLQGTSRVPSLRQTADDSNYHREETQCTYPLRITQKNHDYRAINLTLDQGACMVTYEEEDCPMPKTSIETLWESAVVAAVTGGHSQGLKEKVNQTCLKANEAKLSTKQQIILQAVHDLLGTARWRFLGVKVVVDGSTGLKKVKIMYETHLQVGCSLIKPVIFGALGEQFNPQGSFIFYRSPQTWHTACKNGNNDSGSSSSSNILNTDNDRSFSNLYCDYEIVQ